MMFDVFVQVAHMLRVKQPETEDQALYDEFFRDTREFRITLSRSSPSQRIAEITGTSDYEAKKPQWTFSGR